MSPVLQDILIEDLHELHGTEREQLDILHTMAEAASAPELERALQQHIETTRGQIERLNKIFELLGEEPEAEVPDAVDGLVADMEAKTGRDADNEVIDLELIAAARKMEHLEIAGYAMVRDMAQALELDEAAKLLDQTLREEELSDKKLGEIAGPLLEEAAAAQEEVEAEIEEAEIEEAEEIDLRRDQSDEAA